MKSLLALLALAATLVVAGCSGGAEGEGVSTSPAGNTTPSTVEGGKATPGGAAGAPSAAPSAAPAATPPPSGG